MAVSRESPIGSAPRPMGLVWMLLLLLACTTIPLAKGGRPWSASDPGQLESAAGSGSGGDPWPALAELSKQQQVYLLRPDCPAAAYDDREDRFRRTPPSGRMQGGSHTPVPVGPFQMELDSILAGGESNSLDTGRLGRAYKPKIMSTARGFGKRQL